MITLEQFVNENECYRQPEIQRYYEPNELCKSLIVLTKTLSKDDGHDAYEYSYGLVRAFFIDTPTNEQVNWYFNMLPVFDIEKEWIAGTWPTGQGNREPNKAS